MDAVNQVGGGASIYAMKKSMKIQEQQVQTALEAAGMQMMASSMQQQERQIERQQAFAQATGRGGMINIAG
ncbi:MAG: hypothetical protein K6347_08545 [Campylobacterales bacterium]